MEVEVGGRDVLKTGEVGDKGDKSAKQKVSL